MTVVGLVETIQRGAVHAEQRRLPIGGREVVEVDQEAHHAIIKAMSCWLQPRMHHLAKVQRGGLYLVLVCFGPGGRTGHGYSAACASSGGGSRHGTAAPRACATASPDRKPSSWKPYPVQAPQNQV